MKSVIISIGDELVLGQVVDTNAAWLGVRMSELGAVPLYHQDVPDDKGAIARALKRAAGEAAFVMVSGGLGPASASWAAFIARRSAGDISFELPSPIFRAHLGGSAQSLMRS